MPIRLFWEEINLSEDGHRIYRDTSPMNPASLPSPLDTVGPNVTQYDDVTAVDGTTYYYRVAAYIGPVEQVSEEISIEAAEFDPATLFQSGTFEGWWFDISDLSTLFQDDAGTVPVTTDGDPVGYITDKSGNGNHATQSTTSNKPIYRTDGTYHWLDFGTTENRFLLVPQVISGSTDRTVCFGLNQDAYGSSSNSRSFLSLQDSASTTSGQDWSPSLESDRAWVRVDGNGSWNYDGGSPPSAECVVTIRWGASYGANVSTSQYRIDGVALSYNSGADQPVNTKVQTNSAIGRAQRQSDTYYDGYMYQMFAIATLLSDTDRNDLETFVGLKSNGIII